MINEGWALICEVGLWGWVAAAIGLIVCAFPTRGEFRIRPAVLWGGSLLMFYAIWCVGMLKA